MKNYGQFCPIAKASEVLSERWTNLVIRELGAGSEKFNDLRKGLPLMSPSLLSSRLKSLETAGLVSRSEHQGSVSYHLTVAGEELKPILLQLGEWGHRWVRTDLGQKDLDPSLLMWDIHRSMNTEYFAGTRTVLMFEFTDYSSSMRRWWLIVSGGEVDVCMRDYGYETDLIVVTDVRTLTAYWIGDLSMNKALKEKRITLSGRPILKRDIGKCNFGAYHQYNLS
jgi:DNA-binding HxlR family transcriptional regulator